MYVESGYLVKLDEDTEVVFVEIKKDPTSIAHSFYEIVYKFKTKTLTCHEISNPIEYMERNKRLNISKIEDQEKLNKYVDYLYEMGIIKSTNEYKIYRARSFSLKNEKYGTSKEDLFKKKN